jgi:hypothetical protein
LRSRLSRARLIRISLARFSASIRWANERSGANPAECGFAGDRGGADMAGDHTWAIAAVQAQIRKITRILVNLNLSLSRVPAG